MARKRKGSKIDGWINLDKPYDMTSTQAVAIVRRLFDAQKAGHAGTLDPLATGILPIALGEATKTVPFAQDRMKCYSFTVKWGEARYTDDAEGDVIATSPVRPDEDAIRAALPAFIGEISQVPPRFSAIKIDGARAYDLARAGAEVEMKSRIVYIEAIELVEHNDDSARLSMWCGKGTYVRSLARDLAERLGTVGYVADLRREAVGPFTLDNAISLDKLKEFGDSARLDELLLPVQTALDDIPALAINEREAMRLKNGQTLSFISRPDMERLYGCGLSPDGSGFDADVLALYQDKPIALVRVQGGNIQPVRVLNL